MIVLESHRSVHVAKPPPFHPYSPLAPPPQDLATAIRFLTDLDAQLQRFWISEELDDTKRMLKTVPPHALHVLNGRWVMDDVTELASHSCQLEGLKEGKEPCLIGSKGSFKCSRYVSRPYRRPWSCLLTSLLLEQMPRGRLLLPRFFFSPALRPRPFHRLTFASLLLPCDFCHVSAHQRADWKAHKLRCARPTWL
jgi:hypothetical protein